MTRPLFDPARIRGAPPPPSPPPPPTPASAPSASEPGPRLSVSQLAALIDSALRTGVPARVRVLGQVSNFHDRTHWYFDLKDAGAVISCAMFAPAARKAGFRPADGIEVVASGRVEFYARQGRTQFYIDSLEPVGAGALELAFRALCDELRARGYFDPDRKRPIPPFPRRIAVITSAASAAWADVRDTVARRCPAVGLALIDVRVQGPDAAPQIARAIRFVSRNRLELGVDSILITRGGGSAEDLWAFNERAVADAVFESAVPVAAAIGHETDTTIAELVADLRCATPSQAAARLTPDRAALAEQVGSLAARMHAALRREVLHQRERLRLLARSPALADPRAIPRAACARLDHTRKSLVAAQRARFHAALQAFSRVSAGLSRLRPAELHLKRTARVAHLGERMRATFLVRVRESRVFLDGVAEQLRAGAHGTVEHARGRAQHLARQLDLVGPAGVLKRGFSLTTTENGVVVTSPHALRTGDLVRTIVAEGAFVSEVLDPSTGLRRGPSDAGAGATGSGRAPSGTPERVKAPPVRTQASAPDTPVPAPSDARPPGPGAQMDLFSGGE